MSWQSISKLSTIERALQHALLGRVQLQADYTSGLTLKTGCDPAGTYGGQSGVYLFIGTGTAVTVVEPESALGAGDEHSEAATIVAPTVSDLHLTLTEALTYDYHVARGAYVRPTTLPTAVGELKVCDSDPLFIEDETKLKKTLPGIHIEHVATEIGDAGSVQYEPVQSFRIRYTRRVSPGEGTSVMLDKCDELANFMLEDPYVGGHVDWCVPTRILGPANVEGGSNQKLLQSGALLVWADFFVEARRQATWTKPV